MKALRGGASDPTGEYFTQINSMMTLIADKNRMIERVQPMKIPTKC